jgi:hypothetical protein
VPSIQTYGRGGERGEALSIDALRLNLDTTEVTCRIHTRAATSSWGKYRDTVP